LPVLRRHPQAVGEEPRLAIAKPSSPREIPTSLARNKPFLFKYLNHPKIIFFKNNPKPACQAPQGLKIPATY
jgi:hypothetical protein